MKKIFTLILAAVALVGFNANAACYVIGDGVNGQSWGGNVGTALTQTSTSPEVYEGTITFNAGGYFGIATQLGSNAGDWSTLNANRYGSSSNGLQVSYGETYTMTKSENCFVSPAAGAQKVVVDITNKTITVGEKPVGVVDLYFRGPITGSDWNAVSTYQFKSTQTANVVELTGVKIQGKFAIASSDWSTKYAAATAADHIVTAGTAFTTTSGGNYNLGLDATYTDATITLNTQTGALTITGTKTTESGIYLRGQENEWNAQAAYQFVDKGDGVFVLEKAVAAGQEFKIADGSWGTINYGGTGLTVNQNLTLVYNGGNLTIPAGYEVESLTVTFDNADANGANTLYVKTAQAGPTLPENLYVVGTPNEWNIAASSIVLTGDGEGVYTGTVALTGGADQQFRFYGTLGENAWDNGSSYGSAVDDGDNHAVTFTNGTYTGAIVAGKGNWIFANKVGNLGVTVDLVNETVTFDGSNLTDETVTVSDLYLADWSGEETTFTAFTKTTENEATVYTLAVTTLPEEFKITSAANWSGKQWGQGYWIEKGNFEYANIPEGGDANFFNKLPENFTLTALRATLNADNSLNLTAVGEEGKVEITALYLADWSGEETTFTAFTKATENNEDVYTLAVDALPAEFKITSEEGWNGLQWGAGYWLQEGNLEYKVPQGGSENFFNKLPENFVISGLRATIGENDSLKLTVLGETPVVVTDYFLASGFGEGETPSFVKFVASENEGEYELALNGTLPAEFKITTSETWEGRDWGSGYWINANVQYNNIPQGGDNMVNKLGEGVVAQKIIISENQDGTLNLKVACAINVDAYYLADWESTEGQTEFHKIAKEEDGTYRLALNGTLPTEFKITNLPTWEGATEWAGGYWIELGNELYTGIPQGGENIQNKLGEAFIAEALVIETGEEGTINLKVEGRYNITTTYYLYSWNEGEEGTFTAFTAVAGEDNLFEVALEAVPENIIITNSNDWQAEGLTKWGDVNGIADADVWHLLSAGDAVDTPVAIEAENVKKIQLRYAGEKVQIQFVTETQKKGDLNGDGSIDGNDVSILLEMVLAGGVSDEQKAVADINGDNSVDGNDVSILLEMVLAGE